MIGTLLTSIHPNPLVGICVILVGPLLGIALAFSDWRNKLGIGTLATSMASAITSVTAEKWSTLKEFITATALLNPLLLTLDLFLATFLVALSGSSAAVFLSNLLPGIRRRDQDAVSKATKKAVTLFGHGVLHYATTAPDLLGQARINELERRNDALWLLQKTLVKEVVGESRGRAHFVDIVTTLGHLVIQHTFGDGTDLQHYRMAFFEKRGDRLEYLVTVNNGDWTAHSMVGFNVTDSFMGEALSQRKPLIYPRDKKWRSKFVKRQSARYNSFIAIPVPCDNSQEAQIGILTVDTVEKDGVFSASRVESLVAFSQLIAALYALNPTGDTHA